MEPRAQVIGVFPLVEVGTTDGSYRFILGWDGEFTDRLGRKWLGSTILSGSENPMVIGDIAPSGSLTVRFIADPGARDPVAQMKALGEAYVRDQPVRFFVQSFGSVEEIGAPLENPTLIMTRRATGLTFQMDGPAQRSITLSYEGIASSGNQQRRRVYNTADHARLIGRQNPSLQYVPHSVANDVSLFG